MSPVVVSGARGYTQDLRRFLQCHANEVTELYQFGFSLVLRCQLVKRFVYGQKFLFVSRRRYLHSIQVDPLVFSTVAHRAFAAGVVDQDASHGLGRGGEKMCAIGKLRSIIPNETQPGFMHQCRGLQGLIGRFAGHLGNSQFPELIVDQRQ